MAPTPSDTTVPAGLGPLLARERALLLAMFFGVVLSGLAFLVVRARDAERHGADFERRARAIAATATDRLQRHQESLFALRNLFHFSEAVSREEFCGAARDLISRQTAVQALEWIERIPGERRAGVERAMRAEGFPGFEFTERISGNDLRRAPDRAEHFPVMFIEPYVGNEPALGFDLRSGTTWPQLQQIAETGQLAASGALPLLDRRGGPSLGYIMELPVYRQPMPADATPAERRERLRGFIFGIFRIDDFVGSLFAPVESAAVEALVLDRSAPPERQFLHFQPATGRPAGRAPSPEEIASGLHLRVSLPHAGRQWELWFRPTPEWLAQQPTARGWLTFGFGILGTGFLVSWILGTQRRAQLVEAEVALRTAELRGTQRQLESDIRRREETERRLRESEERLQAILDNSPAAIFVKDPAGRYVLCNAPFERLTEKSRGEIIGRSDAEIFPPGPAAIFTANDRAVLAAGRPMEFEESNETAAGRHESIVQKFPLRDAHGTIYALCGIATEVTARKQAEAEKRALERSLLEAQKLESLGVLAGGIAHDFNNLLTAMLGNASLARFDLPPGSPADRNLERIEQTARRAADLCQQMLAYAGRRALATQAVSVSELVRSTATLLAVSIRKNTRLELRLAEDLPAVEADQSQVQQIVMNLVINAADAIGDRPGEITITTGVAEHGAAFFRGAVVRPEGAGGRFVNVTVADNGGGMPPEVLRRIFEPFFTTKFSGRGLGLAAVLGIVQSHRGALFVESTAGVGSVFRLYLPASAQPAPPAGAPGGPVRPARATARGTVLVIDDEEDVREIVGGALRHRGYAVAAAADGADGLRQYGEMAEPPRVVLLDMTMPGLSGDETLRRLRAVNPKQRVVIMSGFSEQEAMQRCAQLGVSEFLAKPFELAALIEKLDRAD